MSDLLYYTLSPRRQRIAKSIGLVYLSVVVLYPPLWILWHVSRGAPWFRAPSIEAPTMVGVVPALVVWTLSMYIHYRLMQRPATD